MDAEQTQAMYERMMKSMITSCFAYGGAEKGSDNFTRYIQEYSNNLSAEVFEEVYAEQMAYLQQFQVKVAVYEDSDGLTYNSLVPAGDLKINK